jgi:hypothetical protein
MGLKNGMMKKETKGVLQMGRDEKAGRDAAERYREGWT